MPQTSEYAASPSDMFRHGYYSGHEDALDGEYNAPIPAEDGADYTKGYEQGHLDGVAAVASLI